MGGSTRLCVCVCARVGLADLLYASAAVCVCVLCALSHLDSAVYPCMQKVWQRLRVFV